MKLTSPSTCRHVWLAAILPFAAFSAFGQAAPAQSANQQNVDEDQPIVLSPFVVSDESEEGYYTPSAVSGTLA